MKPLELVAYAWDEEYECYRHPTYGFRISPLDVDHWLEGKRLTPSECAAEYFNNLASHGVFAGGRRSGKTLQMNRTHALYRFATLPHAAEKDYE